MIRNSIIYRRIWYIKRRNSRRIYIYFRLLSIIIILVMTAFYAENYSIPYIESYMGEKVKSIVETETENAILDILSDQSYQGSRDAAAGADEQSASLIDEDMQKSITSEVTTRLKERLEYLDTKGIRFPLGALLGNTIFADAGPLISAKSKIYDEMQSQLKIETSDSYSVVNNSMYMYIRLKVGIRLFLKERLLEVKTSIPINKYLVNNT